ncbi:UDP-N-acetylmuramate dehydrogenase [Candidatus Sumerlaeota bacterium]|nr:UDP-N-acetylmuramate dehydrogenase [Candidatus Sumerlaeota bacterium]
MMTIPTPSRAENVDLSTLTTMATPGVARLVITAPDSDSLQGLLRDLAREHEPFILLGGGSNTIFTRREVQPAIIRLGEGFDFIESIGEPRGGRLRTGAATNLTTVLQFALRQGLMGLEWAVGIPGTVGGAVVGNAGARGEAMGDSVERVLGLTRAGEPVCLERGDLHFEYRDSNLRDLVVTEIELRLEPGEPDAIRARMAEFRAARRGQPYGDHSSGCVFRNPSGDFAGRLIDELGLKGFAVGEARVSPAHANFLINDGDATPEDVVALIEQVRQRVRESRGIELRTEVILVDPDTVEAAS